MKDQKVSERCTIITLLLKRIYGMANSLNIRSAPPRQTLSMFGGYMSISEFRNNSRDVDHYKLNLLGCRFIYPEVTEVINVKRKIVDNGDSLRISRNITI